MTPGHERRLNELEKKVNPKKRIVTVVDWDPEPGEEEEGVNYVYWDDIDYEAETDDDD